MHFQLYKDAACEWRWRLVAENGQTFAESGEGYKRKIDALAAIDLVKASSDAPIKVKTARRSRADPESQREGA